MKYHQLNLELPKQLSLSELLDCKQSDRFQLTNSLAECMTSAEELKSEILAEAGQAGDEKILDSLLEFAIELAPQVCGVRFPEIEEKETTRMVKLLRKAGQADNLAHLVDSAARASSDPSSLLVQESLEYLLDFALRLDAGDKTKPQINSIAETTSKAFAVFCRSEGTEVEDEFEEQLFEALKSFLADLCRFQEFTSPEEIAFAETLAWLRDVASSFELDVAQWTFLFASLEQAFYFHSGPQSARHFTTFCDRFQKAAPGFAFVGDFLRQTERIAIKLLQDKELPYVEFEWEHMLALLLAQETLEMSGYDAAPLYRFLLRAEKPLSGTTADDLATVMVALVNASRELVERNWLDKLEDAAELMTECLRFQEHWQENEEAVEDTVAKAAFDIKQTFEIFQEAETLEAELVTLLRESSECALVKKTLGAARNDFRISFILRYALPSPELWKQSAPIIRSIVTAFGKGSPNRYLLGGTTGLSVFSSIEETSGQSAELLSNLAQAQKAILGDGSSSEHNQVSTLLHRTTLNRLAASSDLAFDATANWFLSRLAPGLSEDKVLTELFLADAAQKIKNEELSETFSRLAASFHRLILSHVIWEHSETIAEKAAARIYREMPEYSEATGGELGMGKCARDSSFALRKLSLALKPSVREPQGSFASWWRTLVNQYVNNRPKGLFLQTADALVDCSAPLLSESSLELLRNVLVPIYVEADGKIDTKEVKYTFPDLRSGVEVATSEVRRNEFRTSIEAAHEKAYEYANSTLSEASWLATSAEEAKESLVSNFGRFIKDGGVNKRLASRLNKLSRDEGGGFSGHLERYVVGLMYGILECGSEEFLARSSSLAFLQASAEVTRLGSLKEELLKNEQELISALADSSVSKAQATRLSKALTIPLGSGAGPWSRFESLRRVYDELAGTGNSKEQLLLVPEALDTFSQGLKSGGWQMEMAGLIEALEELISNAAVLEVQKKISQAEDFLFSPNPTEESEWRSLSFYSLLSLLPCGEQFPKPASVQAVFSICSEPGFLERFEKVVEFLGEPLSSHDSNRMLELGRELARANEWCQLLVEEDQEIKESLEGLSGTLSPEDARSLMSVFALGAQHSQRWSIPTESIVAPALLKSLVELKPEDRDKSIEEGKSALDGPELQGLWTQGWSRLLPLLEKFDAFSGQWASNAPKTEHKELSSEVCQRDQKYLKRRLAVDGWASASGAFEWYRREVAGYTGDHTRETYLEMVQNVASDNFEKDEFSISIATVDLVRNFHNGFVSRPDSGPSWALARTRRLGSIRRREEALRQAHSGSSKLFRDFQSECAKGLYCEQLTGLSSRVEFEKLRARISRSDEAVSAVQKEHNGLLGEVSGKSATEFFAKWDLFERRADHIACLELHQSLPASLLESEVSQIWADTLSSYPEPSAFGNFLRQLPNSTSHQELGDFVAGLEAVKSESPRVLSILRSWITRLKLVQENLSLLSESRLSPLSRSLVIGAVCSQVSEQLAEAVSWDYVLEQESDVEFKLSSSRLVGAWKQVQETFLSEDLSGVRREVKRREQVLSLWGRREEWKNFASKLEEKLWDAFPRDEEVSRQTHQDFLEALPLVLCQPKKTPTFWEMSSFLTSFAPELLSALQSASAEDRKRWQTAVQNAASRAELPEELLTEAFAALELALEHNEEACAVLANLDQGTDIGASTLLNLKLAADILNGNSDSHQAAVWLVQVFMSDRKAAPKPLVKSVKALLSKIGRNSKLDGVQEKCKSLKLRLDEASKVDTLEQMLVELEAIAHKSDNELASSRGWFAKLSDSFEAVVGG